MSGAGVGPVVLSRAVDIVSPRGFSRFRFRVSLTVEHPDMPAMMLSTGNADVQVYPTADQAREMAAMLIELAEVDERRRLIRDAAAVQARLDAVRRPELSDSDLAEWLALMPPDVGVSSSPGLPVGDVERSKGGAA